MSYKIITRYIIVFNEITMGYFLKVLNFTRYGFNEFTMGHFLKVLNFSSRQWYPLFGVWFYCYLFLILQIWVFIASIGYL